MKRPKKTRICLPCLQIMIWLITHDGLANQNCRIALSNDPVFNNIKCPTRAGGIIVKYINNSLHLARRYARKFVRGYYLIRKVNSFPRAQLQKNCELRGTDNVQGQISDRDIVAPNGQMEAILFFIFQIFLVARAV